MFHHARIKLTFLYTLIFLVLFWSLSLGMYFWMNYYFGEKGKDINIHISNEMQIRNDRQRPNEPPSDIIMDELRDVLITIDMSLLFIIPAITWFLTGKTLSPVQLAYDKEKRFLTDASHDLRTPLTILNGEIEVSLQKKLTINEYKKTLQSNKEEVNDLIALVENMLFLSREELLYQTSQKETIDMTDLLAERTAVFQKSANLKKLQLQFEFPKQSILIKGNQQLLKRMFTNLLDNAVKYTTAGKITVKLSQKNDSSIVKIIDSGIGISPLEQDKVYERFFRSDISRSEKGYGLGLSIAKQIVTFHGGDISLASIVGKGTTVTVTFPALV